MVRYLPDRWQTGLTMIGKSFALRYRRANAMRRCYELNDSRTLRRKDTMTQQPKDAMTQLLTNHE